MYNSNNKNVDFCNNNPIIIVMEGYYFTNLASFFTNIAICISFCIFFALNKIKFAQKHVLSSIL